MLLIVPPEELLAPIPTKKLKKHSTGPVVLTEAPTGTIDSTQPPAVQAIRQNAKKNVTPPRVIIPKGRQPKQRTSGLFLRVTDSEGNTTKDIDHAAIKTVKFNSNCNLGCCGRKDTGFDYVGDTNQTDFIRGLRDEYRDTHSKSGNKGLDRFLCTFIVPTLEYDKTSNPFKRKGQIKKGHSIQSW